MSINLLNWSQFKIAAGETKAFISKFNGYMSALETLIPGINTAVEQVNTNTQTAQDAAAQATAAAKIATGDVIDDAAVSDMSAWSSQKIEGELKKIPGLSISGPDEVVMTTSTAYQINVLDDFTAYSASVDSGSVSVSGNTITLTAPAAPGDISLTVSAGDYSRVIPITVISDAINQPASVTPPADIYLSRSGAALPVSAGAYTTQAGIETHQSTDWELRSGANGSGSVLFQSLNDTSNLTTITSTAQNLSAGTTYYLRARYRGHLGSVGDWTEVSFATPSQFVPTVPGTPFGGGYYVGDIMDGANSRALIVAPKSAEFETAFSSTSTVRGVSSIDGYANTYGAGEPPASHQAHRHCYDYAGGGYNDWYLPAILELEVAFRNLKPYAANNYIGSMSLGPVEPAVTGSNGTNAYGLPGDAYTSSEPAVTTVTAFQYGNGEDLYLNYVWSSSESGWGGNAQVAIIYFYDGRMILRGRTSPSTKARPFRSVEVLRQ